VVGRGETGSGDSFRAGVRVAVFKQTGLVLARPLWVENTGRRGWRLVEVDWFCRPSIGGSPEDDVVGGADVPNCYRAARFWTDSRTVRRLRLRVSRLRSGNGLLGCTRCSSKSRSRTRWR
jgi:hypothetical protein